jgi:hypothetical protein
VTERDSTANTVAALNTEHNKSITHAEPEGQIKSIGTLMQHLFYSDNVAFAAALYALHVDLVKYSTQGYHVVAVGGWLVVKKIVFWIEYPRSRCKRNMSLTHYNM